VDMPRAATPGRQTVGVAGGCFWGVEAVFRHVKGVVEATSGYAGGAAATARYDLVSDGDTGHAESVRVTFDQAQVSLGQLLQVFFSVAHNATEVNRQGPDTGTQYRSAIFVSDAAQRRVVGAYIALDCDVLDPSEIACFMPEPDGPSVEDVFGMIERVAGRVPVVGIGLTGLVNDPANPPRLRRFCAAAGVIL